MTQSLQETREKAVDYIEKLRAAVAKRQKEMDCKYHKKSKSERRGRPTSYNVYNPTDDILSVLVQTPGLSIQEIADELEVPPTKLKHWIKKLLANETIKKLEFRSQYRTIRYYLSDYDTSTVETRDPNTPTNIVLNALESGPKDLKHLRNLVCKKTGTTEQNSASNALAQLIRNGKVERIEKANYRLKGEPTK